MGLMAPNYGARVRPDRPGFVDTFGAALQRQMELYQQLEARKRDDEQQEQGLVIAATNAGYRPDNVTAAALPTASPIAREPLPEIHPGFNRAPDSGMPLDLPAYGTDPTMPAFGAKAPVLPHPNRNAVQAVQNEDDILRNMETAAARPHVTVGGQRLSFAPEAVAAEKAIPGQNVLARQLYAIGEEVSRGTLTPQEAADARLRAQGVDPRSYNQPNSYAHALELERERQEGRIGALERASELRRDEIHAQGEEQRRTRSVPSLSRSLTPRVGHAAAPKEAPASAYYRKRYDFYRGQKNKYGPAYEENEAQEQARADTERMFPGLLEEPGVTRRGTGTGLPRTLGPVPRF